MDAADWILQLLLGGFLGLLGQGIRVVAGLKKVYDQSKDERVPFARLFDIRLLSVSLLVGFIAGALATLAMSDGAAPLKFSKDLAVGLLGAGYGGTDFIEGFIKKYLPSSQTGYSATAAPVG